MKKTIALLLTAGMALSMAACGSTATSKPVDSATSASSATAASSASGTSESAAAASTSDFSNIKTVTDGELHMATNAAFPPYEMTDDNGGYTGIDVDIATEIAKELGLKLVVDDMDFSSVITSVQSGKEDIAMAGITVSDERKKNVDFTDTYATGVQSVIVPEDSDIKSVDDLSNDKMIGCQEGTTGYIYASADPSDGGFGEDHVVAYTNGAMAIQALLGGKVDAVIIDNEPAKAFVAENKGLKILNTDYVTEDYAIGVSKDNTALKDAINTILKKLIADGTVQSIIDKYINADSSSENVSASSSSAGTSTASSAG
ncbi:MAG: ABC transporter substrate-binding protein [Bilifractor sp.]